MAYPHKRKTNLRQPRPQRARILYPPAGAPLVAQGLLRRSYQLEILSLTTQQINAVLETPVILRTLVSSSIKITGATAGAAGLVSDGQLVFSEFNDQGTWQPVRRAFVSGEGIPGRAMQTGEPYWTNDPTADVDAALWEPVILHNLVCVPILSRAGEFLGCVLVYNKPMQFDEDDVHLLQGLAASAAVALENARMLCERGEVETRLREREAQLAGIIDTAMDAIVTFDADQCITRCNRAALDMFQYTLSDVLGQPIECLLPERYHRLHRRYLEAFGDSHETRRSSGHLGVLVGRRKDGDEFPVEISISTVEIQGQRLYTAIIRDVTERRRAEKELHEHERQLTLLNAITRSAIETVSQREMLALIAERLCEYMHADGCYVALWDEGQQCPIPAAGYGTLSDSFNSFRLEPGEPSLAAAALQQGHAISVEDIRQTSHISPRAARALPTRSLLALPLIVDSQKLAIAYIAFDSHHSFSPDEIALGEQAAQQTALALAKVIHSAQSEERLARLAALHEIELALVSVSGLDERLNLLLDHTRARLQTDIANVLLIDPASGNLREYASQGTRHAQAWQAFQLKVGQGIAGWIATHGQPLAIADVSEDSRWHRALATELEGIVSFMGAPLRVNEQTIGVLGVSTRTRREFTSEEIDFISTLAGQAAGLIENSRLLDEAQRRLADLEAINRISTSLRMAPTLDEMLPRLLDETLAVVGATAGMIALSHPTEDEIKTAAARGWFSEMLTTMPPDTYLDNQVLLTGQVKLLREFRTDLDSFAPLDIPEGWGGALVPIQTHQQMVGILGIGVQLPRELTAQEVHLLTTIAEIAGNAIHRTRLHESLEEAYLQTVLALANAIDARDSYTGSHGEHLADMATAVSEALELPREEQETIRFAARLHDIGKIGVPDSILRKPGPLSEEEWHIMRQHPTIGADIIRPVERLQQAVPIVKHHQEKYDGSGYPDGLAGEAIPLGARILAVVDAFSAITDDRVYRRARTRTQALEEISRCAGRHFDPQIVSAFIQVASRN